MSAFEYEQLSQDVQAKYKTLLLQTMCDFDRFCQQHSIRYVGAYGTVLGAIRHKGLIPWDDDIDVMMDRENYEKFLSFRNDSSLGPYEILDDTLKGYVLPFAKFSLSKTTIWERRETECVLGVFIDVFPIDKVQNEEESEHLHHIYLKTYQKFVYAHQSLISTDISIFVKRVLCRMFRGYIRKKKQRIEKQFKSVCGNQMMYYRSQTCFKKALMPEKWLKETIRVPFESFEIAVPLDFDGYLKHNYGDYMTLPPLEKRISQHYHYFVDLEHRYTIDEIKTIKKHA